MNIYATASSWLDFRQDRLLYHPLPLWLHIYAQRLEGTFYNLIASPLILNLPICPIRSNGQQISCRSLPFFFDR